jgi:hypothetical protein
MDEILIVGQVFHCCICGGEHIATEALLGVTMVRLKDEKTQYRPIPTDATEKAAWIAEVRAALASIADDTGHGQ